MVRAFSRILRREPDGGYVLVTPVEKLDIAVEDAPFVAVEMKAEGDGRDAMLAFRLNTGEVVTAGPDHPLRFEERDDGPHPYVRVRGGLDALVSRAIYYDLAERALAGDEGVIIDERVANAERETGFRNFALANYMRAFGNIRHPVERTLG
ncbi:hypothetical protein LTR94_033477, partial [Friedmanniomyces endolithicus]